MLKSFSSVYLAALPLTLYGDAISVMVVTEGNEIV